MSFVIAIRPRLLVSCYTSLNLLLRQPQYQAISQRNLVYVSKWRQQLIRPEHTNLLVHQISRRTIFQDVVPAFLFPPAVFVGLVFTLWFYKCCMMILFQNKIIYMPSMPPFSRQEKLLDYANTCFPVVWKEEQILSTDGTKLVLCVGQMRAEDKQPLAGGQQRIIVLYLQGNASSTPPRLPGISRVIQSATPSLKDGPRAFEFEVVALSYRGFWKSRGHASQKGIERDTEALMEWVQYTYAGRDRNMTVPVVLWGQSIGAGIAVNAAARYLSRSQPPGLRGLLQIHGMILETPFCSIRTMLTALYPQNWLPYRYLWPFLRNWWESEEAFRTIATVNKARSKFPVYVVVAGKDEVVPREQPERLMALCRELGFHSTWKEIPGALHTEVMIRADGRKALADALRGIAVTKRQETHI
ncbi:Alpha/Beta hydrolase protein [Lineolata rhizophorae]|uniref:Alpha/Beta hydrolase protein n=1 Tax=Lineolata rhizophorae TaxID=578093 RepID=A0A6A6P341_9PEZI|nr:Alpha/Beta hydrolase protein [Lineolata rhizophorae]